VSTPGGVRYRIVLISLPEDADDLRELLPRRAVPERKELPMVLRLTDDTVAAVDTVDRLRAAGAGVVVVREFEQGELFCPAHSAEYAIDACSVCTTALCSRCRLEARGARLCPAHHREHVGRTRTTRVRQLLLVLGFVVFLQQVVEHLRQDARALDGGTVLVGLFQYAPGDMRRHQLVRQLNGRVTDGFAGPSWRDVKAWYDLEYSRYVGAEREFMELRTYGPEDFLPTPPKLHEAEGTLTLLWRSVLYPRYWNGLLRDQGLSPDNFDVRVFVVFTPQGGDVASHSRGSEKGRLAVAWVSAEEWNPAYALVTIAHELGHTLGASDKYDEASFHATYPEGYVEPFVRPLYPQRYAELMAVDIPLSRTAEREASELREVRIGHRTAAELGWISASEAAWFYAPEEESPLERLQSEGLQPEDP